MRLTDKACKAAKANETNRKTPRKLSDGRGLQLWVMPNGSKYWRYKYRIRYKDRFKEKVLALGVYPDVSLAEAREKHLIAYKLVAQGVDPALEKRKTKVEQGTNSGNTFKVIALEWKRKRQSEVKEVTYSKIENILNNDIFPEIGNVPIKDLTPLDILAALRKIESRGAYEIVARARQYCSQIFRYAIATGKMERDITLDITDALVSRRTRHQPAFSPDDIPEFLKVLAENRARLYLQTRLALKILLLTFVRPIELVTAEWEEVNLSDRLWTIPGAKMKMGMDHIVPLSNQVISIMEGLREENGNFRHLFINRINPNQHLCRDTLSKAIRNMGFQGRHTPHGFRALARTTIREKLNYDSEIIERQLSHSPNTNLGRAYDRTQFLEQRVAMMQDWADYIDNLK